MTTDFPRIPNTTLPRATISPGHTGWSLGRGARHRGLSRRERTGLSRFCTEQSNKAGMRGRRSRGVLSGTQNSPNSAVSNFSSKKEDHLE